MSIGYACMVIGEINTKISGCTLRNATENELRRLTEKNLFALEEMINYNSENRIKLFRISSDIIPFGSHPVNTLNWQEEFKEQFARIGEKMKASSVRVSMHPGQYTVLNSLNEEIVKRAIADLEYHTAFLEALSTDCSAKIVLHIGGVYENKEDAIKRFINHIGLLKPNIKNRLVLENDDVSFTAEDVYGIAKTVKLPMVFDNLHNRVNPSVKDVSEVEWIKLCGETWQKEDGKQKIHYSQNSLTGKKGSHSETIAIKEFGEFYNSLSDQNIDIMLEVKDKNLSALKCVNTFERKAKTSDLENEWARYKYLVLSRSASLYNEIRELLKDKEQAQPLAFYAFIEKALAIKEDIGASVNAALHVWGYFKNSATEAEKNRFYKLVDHYKNSKIKESTLKNYFFKCAVKYNTPYLIKSHYFYL